MTQQRIVDRLVALGMTTYEAKVFLALTKLGEARVSDINAVTDVPRPAIYETLEKLEQRGIIEVSTGRPKSFRALPPKAAISKIESEIREAVDEATSGLEELAGSKQRGTSDVRIWIVRGRGRVLEKIAELVGSCKKELFAGGQPNMLMDLEHLWKGAKSRKVKVRFMTREVETVLPLKKYGRVTGPNFNVKELADDYQEAIFLNVDGSTILFASEHKEEDQTKDLTAFWTDDENFVKFVNYVTEPIIKPKGKKASDR